MSCRVCLETSDCLELLFPDDNDIKDDNGSISFAELINQCSDIPPITRNDGFPQYLCVDCEEMLEGAIRFRKLCKRSDAKMRKIQRQTETVAEYLTETEEPEITSRMFSEATTSESIIDLELEQIDSLSQSSLTGLNENDVCSTETEEHQFTGLMLYEATETIQDLELKLIDCLSQNSLTTNTEDSICRTDSTSIRDSPGSEPFQLNQSSPSADTHQIYHCDQCPRICTTAHSRERHIQYHLNIHKHTIVCSICNKTFQKVASLNVHMAQHSNERPYICEYCGKTFKTSKNCSYHRKIHKNTKMFFCSICPYQSVYRHNLNSHQLSHTGLRLYKCPKCPRTFSSCSNRTTHIRTHHEKIRDYPCDQCDMSFFTRCGLQKHMPKHSATAQFPCEYCSMEYRFQCGLRKHMRKQHPEVQKSIGKRMVKEATRAR